MEKTIDPAHEIGENVTITERSQLLSITPEQAKKIKSLRIENQTIDDDFRDFLLSINRFDSLYFYRCSVDCLTLSGVYQCNTLGFVDCSLTSMSVTFVLDELMRLEYVEILDLSNNRIGVDPEPFCQWWTRTISGVVGVKKLILSDNDFLDASKARVLSDFGKYSPGCQVVF
jgi:hypothetical protein